jgi:uncharacterized OB-fold protein
MAYDRPLPVPDPVTKPFWDGLRARELRIQKCEACGGGVFYPRVVCPSCGSRKLAWVVTSGRATLHAFTIAHRGVPGPFKTAAPYVVALVDLEGGGRIMANLVGVQPTPEAIRIGMRLTAAYEDVTDAVTLLRFVPE